MSQKEEFELKKREELSVKEKEKVDAFILKKSSNGEFINTLKFLEYHPKGRFEDDSIVILDKGSQTVRGVLFAAKAEGGMKIISHPGTTFAGPVIDRKINIETAEKILNIMLEYYEAKYKEVVLKTTPAYYALQPYGMIDYYLLKRGYVYGNTALANIINISQIETEEDVLLLFDSKRRNQVRKVIKSDIFLFEEGDKIESNVWHNMNKNLADRFESHTTHTYGEIVELKERCSENIKPYYVRSRESEYGAFGLVFFYKNVFHTQYLDLNYAYAKQYPNLLLIYELIKKARVMGYQYFSFGASTEQGGKVLNYGLYEYKAGYGGGDILLPVFYKKKEKI